MNKKLKILIIICTTIIISIIAYSQVLPLKIKHPSNDFKPIEIKDANANNQDNNMILSFLYNLSREIHPTGSEANYRVREYIEKCLTEMDVAYEIQSTELDEVFFEEKRQSFIDIMEDVKSNAYDEIKKYAKGKDVDSVVKAELGYNSFEEYFNTELMNGSTIEKEAQEYYDEKLAQYKGETLNNIFINLSNQQEGQNILLVAHYDSDIESYGAGDDGIAVASLLETIRCSKDKNLKNNIYVLITDGEENNYWGAIEFIKNTNIDFDLVINFDNSGNSGNPNLYHYSNDSIAKQYFKSVKNETSYSFSNDLIYNPASEYFQGEVSDAFIFSEEGYNTLDFSLIGTPYYYHSKNDTFENIDVKSLNTLTKTMIELVDYYGNNNVIMDSAYKSVNFKIVNGLEFSVSKTMYLIVSVLLILANLIFTIIMFKKKEKIIKRILSILCIALATITLILLQNFSILISLPMVIYFITDYIKNKIAKEISRIVLFELYLLVILQPLIMIMQFIIWLNVRN